VSARHGPIALYHPPRVVPARWGRATLSAGGSRPCTSRTYWPTTHSPSPKPGCPAV